MDCNWLKNQMGLSCQPVETVNGETALHIQTAHTWTDNTPLSFYLINQDETILLTDECETIFYLHGQGLAERLNFYNKIRELLDCTNSTINIENDGEIICIGAKSNTPQLISDYISALCAIMHYERTNLGIAQDDIDFADEVEMYLKIWKPKSKFSRNPEIKGLSGHDYRLDISMDDKLIMTIKPTPNAVGSVLRKTSDIIQGDELNGRELMVVVDNRTNDLFREKAKEEIKILSSMIKAIPLSNITDKIPSEITTSH